MDYHHGFVLVKVANQFKGRGNTILNNFFHWQTILMQVRWYKNKASGSNVSFRIYTRFCRFKVLKMFHQIHNVRVVLTFCRETNSKLLSLCLKETLPL